MPVWYNDNDEAISAWLTNLVNDGRLPDGVVDGRDIADVSAKDLRGYAQHHFFAGIGGWSLALRQAGWADDTEVATVSCPCQPFSFAGTKKGDADERHLWPFVRSLLDELRPANVFGEQVASPLGRKWFSGVRGDLESMGYRVCASDLPAASVGAPHVRQRLYFAAFQASGLGDSENGGGRRAQRQSIESNEGAVTSRRSSASRDIARERYDRWRDGEWLLCSDGNYRRAQSGAFPLAYGLPGRMVTVCAEHGVDAAPVGDLPEHEQRNLLWCVECGRVTYHQRFQEATPSRVTLLSGYGNAIVVPQAAAFIELATAARSDISETNEDSASDTAETHVVARL